MMILEEVLGLFLEEQHFIHPSISIRFCAVSAATMKVYCWWAQDLVLVLLRTGTTSLWQACEMLIPGCCPPINTACNHSSKTTHFHYYHVEVSLDKILDPKLLLQTVPSLCVSVCEWWTGTLHGSPSHKHINVCEWVNVTCSVKN